MWRGRPVFDTVPVAEPVAELNRCGRQAAVVVGGQSSAGLRLGALYQYAANVYLALPGADLHCLIVRDRGNHQRIAPA